MKKYLGNALSLQMLDLTKVANLRIEPISPQDVPADAESVVGHPDTARVLSGILGRPVPFNRANLHLTSGDVLYVAQLTGGRLPEGATELPEGFAFSYLRVTIEESHHFVLTTYAGMPGEFGGFESPDRVFSSQEDAEAYVKATEPDASAAAVSDTDKKEGIVAQWHVRDTIWRKLYRCVAE